MGEPNRLECQTDPSDACTHMQRVADESREPTDNLEHVRRSQNGCKKSNLPAKPLRTHPEEPKRPGNQADPSSGRMHVQSGRIDVKVTARMVEVISTTPNKQKPCNSPVGAGSWCRNGTNRLGNIADASTTHGGMLSNQNGMRTTAKTRKTISKTLINPKTPNSPVSAKFWRIGEADGWGNHADGSGMCKNTQCIKTDMKTAKNASRNIKMRQRRSKRQNSPCRAKTEMAKHPERWDHVSNNGNDRYALQIALIESLDMRNGKIVFG